MLRFHPFLALRLLFLRIVLEPDREDLKTGCSTGGYSNSRVVSCLASKPFVCCAVVELVGLRGMSFCTFCSLLQHLFKLAAG